jgi:hypothetical protein
MEALEGEDLSRFSREPRDARYVSSRTPPRTFDAQGNAHVLPRRGRRRGGTRPGRHPVRCRTRSRSDHRAAAGGSARWRTQARDDRGGFSTQQAEQLKPSHLIGTFTTYHPLARLGSTTSNCSPTPIDGTVLLPGEQFSINEISGVRSCDKGYREDGMILRGELVDVCGGGTSQFGTTTFNAAFFAGVQLDQWKAHSWYISRYPMGREATLNYPVLDVKFTNTTPGAIIVKTTYTPSSITVSLYGQPIARVGHRDARQPDQPHGLPRDPSRHR